MKLRRLSSKIIYTSIRNDGCDAIRRIRNVIKFPNSKSLLRLFLLKKRGNFGLWTILQSIHNVQILWTYYVLEIYAMQPTVVSLNEASFARFALFSCRNNATTEYKSKWPSFVRNQHTYFRRYLSTYMALANCKPSLCVHFWHSRNRAVMSHVCQNS